MSYKDFEYTRMYEADMNTATLWIGCISLVLCCYALAVICIFRGYKIQTRRIAMFVLITDVINSVANILSAVGDAQGDAKGDVKAGFFMNRDWRGIACFTVALNEGGIYVSGLAMLVMVLSINYTVILERSEFKHTIEKAAYCIVVLFFLVLTAVIWLDCDGACQNSLSSTCRSDIRRWDIGFNVIASLVFVAFFIAGVRLVQRRRALIALLRADAGGGTLDEHGGFVPVVRTKAERINAERMAAVKKRAVKDAIFMFAPFAVGFIVAAAANIQRSKVEGALANPSNYLELNSMFRQLFFSLMLSGLQPLLNVLALLVQHEFRAQLDPRKAWKRFRRRMGWDRRRKKARRVRVRSVKHDADGVFTAGAVRFADDTADSDGGNDGTHSGAGHMSDGGISSDSTSTDDDTSYAAAEGPGDVIQLIQLPNPN